MSACPTGPQIPAVDSYRYERRVGGKVTSATGRTLKPTSAMCHKQITVTVIAVKTGHTDGRTTSAAVTVR